MEETKVKTYKDRERERAIITQEREELAFQTRLERSRILIKKDFPNLKIEETIEALDKLRQNPQCTTCSYYYSQSSRADIKNKIKGIKIENDQTLLLRIYKNSAEKLEDSKGYCCKLISPIKHTITMIPVPDLSLCSEWKIHNNLGNYIMVVRQMLNDEKDKENKKLEKRRIALEGKYRAEQVIKEFNKNYPE